VARRSGAAGGVCDPPRQRPSSGPSPVPASPPFRSRGSGSVQALSRHVQAVCGEGHKRSAAPDEQADAEQQLPAGVLVVASGGEPRVMLVGCQRCGYCYAGISPPVWAKVLLVMRQRPSLRQSVKKFTKFSVPRWFSSVMLAAALSPA
jgi:hypothetical protein